MGNKAYTTLTTMILLILSALTITSCNNDEPNATGIEGTWKCSLSNSNYSLDATLVLNKDATGSLVEYVSEAIGSSENHLYFYWSTTTDSDGNDYLKISYKNGDNSTVLIPVITDSSLKTLKYALTGEKLHVYGVSDTFVFDKK